MRTREQSIAAHRGHTVAELATRWGCSPDQVLGLIVDRKLRAINVARKDARRPSWRVMHEDLMAYETRHDNQPVGA